MGKCWPDKTNRQIGLNNRPTLHCRSENFPPGGGGVLGLMFARYVPLAYPILVLSMLSIINAAF